MIQEGRVESSKDLDPFNWDFISLFMIKNEVYLPNIINGELYIGINLAKSILLDFNCITGISNELCTFNWY